jgi:hypothetical protein
MQSGNAELWAVLTRPSRQLALERDDGTYELLEDFEDATHRGRQDI